MDLQDQLFKRIKEKSIPIKIGVDFFYNHKYNEHMNRYSYERRAAYVRRGCII